MVIRIIKEGKYCIDPAKGPIVDMIKGVLDTTKMDQFGFNRINTQMLIDNKWAERADNKKITLINTSKDFEIVVLRKISKDAESE